MENLKKKFDDVYEWPTKQNYPQKIAFRKALEIVECDRYGNLLN